VTVSPTQLRRPGCGAICSARPATVTVFVARDHPLLFVTENPVEIDVAERDERTRRIARRARERGVVLRHELLHEIAVGGLERRDPRHAQLVDQPALQRPIEALAPPARLRRIRRDVLDAQPGERPPHLRQPPPIHRAFRLRRVKGPMRAVGVEGHGNALRVQNSRQARHHRVRTFARIERGLEHALRRIVGHRDETGPDVGRQRQPRMDAAIEMQHLAEARARLPSEAMAATRPMLLD
jgi:hypothetical protein